MNNSNNFLNYDVIDKNKIVIDNISVPDYKLQLKHNILNIQINDKAYYNLIYSYKNLYDSLCLTKKNKKSRYFYNQK